MTLNCQHGQAAEAFFFSFRPCAVQEETDGIVSELGQCIVGLRVYCQAMCVNVVVFELFGGSVRTYQNL